VGYLCVSTCIIANSRLACPANPAFGDNKVDCDFTKGECDAFHGMIGTNLKYDGKGAWFVINKESDAPTIRTDNYIFFGRVDVVVQAAQGQGVVTSAVLQSDDLDEIDWEWVGGDNAQVQSNYFSKGDTTTYDRAVYHPVSAPLTSTHKYSVEWTSTKIDWLIDDAVVRTLNAADAKGGSAFPQTPMQIKLGTWVAGGKDSNAGTREWAGGYVCHDPSLILKYADKYRPTLTMPPSTPTTRALPLSTTLARTPLARTLVPRSTSTATTLVTGLASR
jgi:hypothetical protein